ncbi:MAG: hypothetical protein VW879_14750 [Opitutae bacterium]
MLPFLFSLGLPALAPTLGITGMSGAALAGLGAGLGSFFETGDVGKGIKTGMLSFLGGKLLGGLGGGIQGLKDTTATDALLSGKAQAAMTQPQFIDAVSAAGTKAPFSGIIGDQAASAILQPGVTTAATIGSAVSALDSAPEQEDRDEDEVEVPMPASLKRKTKFGDPLTDTGEQVYFDYTYSPQPDLEEPYIDYGTLQKKYRERGQVQRRRGGGLMSLHGSLQAATHPMFSGLQSGITQALQQDARQKVGPFIQKVEQDARAEFGDAIFQPQNVAYLGPQPQPLFEAAVAQPFDGALVERLPTKLAEAELLQNTLRGSFEPDLQVRHAGMGPITPRGGKGGGLGLQQGSMFQSALGFAEGGEVEAMNEKDIIMESIKAIKGMKDDTEAQEVLGMFLAKYGEEALRDLVSSVQSGEFDETVERFENGENGIVRGPGDGSGSDDKVPATLDNQQDVLLTEGEYVFREPTTDALTKAYGGGFLDKINEAEEKAPEVLRKMVG